MVIERLECKHKCGLPFNLAFHYSICHEDNISKCACGDKSSSGICMKTDCSLNPRNRFTNLRSRFPDTRNDNSVNSNPNLSPNPNPNPNLNSNPNPNPNPNQNPNPNPNPNSNLIQIQLLNLIVIQIQIQMLMIYKVVLLLILEITQIKF